MSCSAALRARAILVRVGSITGVTDREQLVATEIKVCIAVR
jgi:hypothetical protein